MSGYPEIKYVGYDFTELHAAFNLPLYNAVTKFNQRDPKEHDSVVLQRYLDGVLRHSNTYWNGKGFVMKYAAKHIRMYLKRLSEACGEYKTDDSKFWKVLSEFESDVNLIQTFKIKCGSAWS
jgi:hypothetical protein